MGVEEEKDSISAIGEPFHDSGKTAKKFNEFILAYSFLTNLFSLMALLLLLLRLTNDHHGCC